MAMLFKCKMCGGNLEVEQESTTGTCAYCGSVMTLPKLDDERRVELFNRGNHFRRNGDYDKAAGVFDIVLGEDPTDAEAYWSLVLCHYGIVYAEDAPTQRRVPTINRLKAASILADADYQQALAHARGAASALYRQEAEAIAAIQKDALAVVNSGVAYDVFICYKESDATGQRTRDSVIAQELYQELERNGIKPFFARVSLEQKTGTEYEPYIFAALQSAKVMVVIGTAKEHLEAVWVRNEWSRYLALVKDDPSRKLFPVYRDMDPYDLPDELAHLEALDASRLGFLQDLVHGLKKILAGSGAAGAGAGADARADALAQAHGQGAAAPGVESLHKRMTLFLEDSEWQQANNYADRILDIDPEFAPAYMGKLLVSLQIPRESELSVQAKASFAADKNYVKALRFADGALQGSYEGYLKDCEARLAEERRLREEEDARRRQEEARKRQAEAERLERERKEKEDCLHREEAERLERERKEKEDCLHREEAERLERERKVKEAERLKREQQEKAQRKRNTWLLVMTGIVALIIAVGVLFDTVINSAIRQVAAEQALNNPVVGSEVYFGDRYWRVLAVEDDRALLVSQGIIGQRRFDAASSDWGTSEIRKWLNDEFLNGLGATARDRIRDTSLTDVGTTDKVFLLSDYEANRYFKGGQDRIARLPNDKAIWWWLRSPGSGGSDYAAYVGDGGRVYTGGGYVPIGNGVRPALWLNLASEIS